MLHFQPPATLLLPCFPSPLNGYGSYDVSNLDEIDLLHLFLLTSVQEQIQYVECQGFTLSPLSSRCT
ncbi:hypothetical protein HMI56_000216 [Coelomomyces lativittatus]|nr:hypothetical protein HMI56_000216 [Coelomomyces lativittatus]